MINVKNLSFDYPGKRALHDVSFEIKPKTITALVGPNGAGKTTLLRCLAALDSWTIGEVHIDEIPVEEQPRNIHKICSYLSDFFGLYDDLTVEQSLNYIAMSRDAPSSKRHDMCVLAAKRLNVLDYYDKQVGTLSRGLRQRVAIAQTIVVLPKVLILDEPASGLDPQARFDLSKLLIELKDEGVTIIVSSHILSELEDYSTHMLMIDKGKILKSCELEHEQAASKVYKLVLSEPIEDHKAALTDLNLNLLSVDANHAMVSLAEGVESKTILQQLIQKGVPVEGFSLEKQSMQQVYLSAKDTKGGDNA